MNVLYNYMRIYIKHSLHLFLRHSLYYVRSFSFCNDNDIDDDTISM